jgi:hypothetical protein
MKGNMSPSRGSGIERGLTFGPGSADRGGMGSSWAPESTREGAPRASERGQALVEFALILPLFLVLLVGLVQFGVGLNYWLDLNRLANQAARWGVVDCNPKSSNVCGPDIFTAIEYDRTSRGNAVQVENVCIDGTPPYVGKPLRVHLKSVFGFKQILNLPGITLRARASMRVEQNPTAGTIAAPGLLRPDVTTPNNNPSQPSTVAQCPP